ncbi:hypothetical protein pb186bvf_008584 [Paramecium bursaria]
MNSSKDLDDCLSFTSTSTTDLDFMETEILKYLQKLGLVMTEPDSKQTAYENQQKSKISKKSSPTSLLLMRRSSLIK